MPSRNMIEPAVAVSPRSTETPMAVPSSTGTSILPFASVRTPIQRYFTDFTAVIHALTEYGKNNLFP